ncbi:hypothetical protein K2173_006784 [Erythroxylum novogranatense]|uniref:F-box domain-containing protein n=1 Tax=Erythroxylum novogranatense TaxID=1862640 RepID=A0AAV8SYY7_9ROSI|nr:hypothetical protein K2173_006784 [Erythroxylum novogranatense]
MAKSVGKKDVGLLKSVEERALHKKEEDYHKQRQIPYFHKDCVSNILLRLPLESLQHARFVCKPWYNIINNDLFIDTHLRSSESVLIFQKIVPNEIIHQFSSTVMPQEHPNTFSVEQSFLQSQPAPIIWQPVTNRRSRLSMQYMEFGEGKSKLGEYKLSCLGIIRATCNGLILLDNKLKRGGLVVMNPVTRKLTALPLGTLYPPERQSYGFAQSDTSKQYKVVHLFRDELGYVNCEILCLGTRNWREVNGPSFGLFGWLGYSPVSALGGLHWIPHIDRSDYIVSIGVDTENFQTTQLPKSCRTHDRIIEMGGSLCFVTHEGLSIDIWNLSGAVWTKQYSITRGSIIDLVPLLSLRISGDVIFRREEDGSFYAYDFKVEIMRKIEMDHKCFPRIGSYLPHVNSLVSWEAAQAISD